MKILLNTWPVTTGKSLTSVSLVSAAYYSSGCACMHQEYKEELDLMASFYTVRLCLSNVVDKIYVMQFYPITVKNKCALATYQKVYTFFVHAKHTSFYAVLKLYYVCTYYSKYVFVCETIYSECSS